MEIIIDFLLSISCCFSHQKEYYGSRCYPSSRMSLWILKLNLFNNLSYEEFIFRSKSFSGRILEKDFEEIWFT